MRKNSLSLVITFVIAMVVFSTHVKAQTLEKHQWKHRVLLLMTEDLKNEYYTQQLDLLQSDIDGLKDRKLIIYSITKKAYATGFDNQEWQNSKKYYSTYKKNLKPFEVILIGLDGDIKLRKSTTLPLKELFSIIDSMPMRINEMRQKKRVKNK